MKRLTEALKCCKLMQIGQLVRVAYSHNNANWDDLYTTRHVEHFQLWYAELVALLNLWLKAQNYKVEISVLMEGVTDQSVPELRATAVADVSVTGAAAPWRNEFFKLRCRFALKVWEKFHHMKYIENHWNTAKVWESFRGCRSGGRRRIGRLGGGPQSSTSGHRRKSNCNKPAMGCSSGRALPATLQSGCDNIYICHGYSPRTKRHEYNHLWWFIRTEIL